MSFPAYFSEWLASPSKRCLLAEVGVKTGGVETTRYLSSIGFVSEPTDTPASTHYAARISGGFSFSRSLDLSGSGGGISSGDLELDNTDGALDAWLADIWSMRTIKMWLGSAEWQKSQFVQVFSGTVEDIAPKDRYRLSLKLRDVLAPLNTQISTAVIGGSGDNKSTLLPIALGEVFNVEPLLLSTTGSQVYRVSLGAVESIIEVRDNGYPVSVTKDAAAGTFTLTNQRYGQITCDVQGATPGAYRNDVGGLVEWVATTLGDGTKLDAAAIDVDAIAAFRAAHPQPVGLWIPSRANRLETMQQLAASLGATVTATPLGAVRIVQLAFGTPTRAVGPAQMVEGTFAPAGRPKIQGSIQLAGCRNWTPQGKSVLAASIAASSLPILEDEWVYSTATDPVVVADYRQTESPEPVETLLVVESDVTAEATRRLALWKTPQTVFRFDGYADLLDLELGDTITLTHPRLGLSGGAAALVVGLETDYVGGRVNVEVLV